MTLIDYQNVEIQQQERTILSGVNFQLNEGEFIYLIGKVGSGKTSLLKTLYGELPLAAGDKCEVMGYDMRTIRRKQIPDLRRRLGIVFQDFQLLTDRNVADNLRFVLEATGWKNSEETEHRIDEVLSLVGMQEMRQKFPHELSGGEQQRIVIARAILNTPAIVLADEPTGNLDEETGDQIVELLRHISANGSAVIMTTHNLSIVKQHPAIVCRCEEGQVRVVTEEFYRQTE